MAIITAVVPSATMPKTPGSGTGAGATTPARATLDRVAAAIAIAPQLKSFVVFVILNTLSKIMHAWIRPLVISVYASAMP
jgi:hypothetical protein